MPYLSEWNHSIFESNGSNRDTFLFTNDLCNYVSTNVTLFLYGGPRCLWHFRSKVGNDFRKAQEHNILALFHCNDQISVKQTPAGWEKFQLYISPATTNSHQQQWNRSFISMGASVCFHKQGSETQSHQADNNMCWCIYSCIRSQIRLEMLNTE